MPLIAGALHQHGDAQGLQLFLHLGAVPDHGVLHREADPLAQQQLVIRGGVFAGIEKLPLVHTLLHLRQGPVIPSGACQTHGGKGMKAHKRVHRRGRGDIEPLKRRPQNGDVGFRRGLRTLGHDEKALLSADGYQRAAGCVIRHGKLIGIAQHQPVRRFGPRLLRLSVCLRTAAEKEREEQQDGNGSLHAAGVIVAASKRSV